MNGLGSDLQPIPDLTGAILAGGQARRMGGINKALLDVDGIAIVDRILMTLRACCDRVIVVANQPEPYLERDLAVFPDLLPGSGSLGGIYTALEVATTERVFVCACDMPFVNGRLLRYLFEQSNGYDAVVPRDQHGLQPMHAIYSRASRAWARERLEKGLLKVEHYLDSIDARIIAPDDVSRLEPSSMAFMNVNCPADLATARRTVSSLPDRRRMACASP